jgi:hypothetical protein
MLSKLTKDFKPIAGGATTPKAWVFLFYTYYGKIYFSNEAI